MKILILHAVPYQKIEYHLGIDHAVHDVTYIGKAEKIEQIPRDLRCQKIVRPGIKSMAEEVLELVGPADTFELVISLSEFELLQAALVREKLGVPGPRYQDLLPVRDKMVMKAVAERAGIRVPKNLNVAGLIETIKEASIHGRPVDMGKIDSTVPWRGKTVLKPTMGASSEGISVHESIDDVVRYLSMREAHGESFESHELEEFVSGSILHVDGIVDQGELRTLVCSRYIGTCLAYAEGQPLASIQIPTSPQYLQWFRQCLKGLNLFQGAFHLEVIESAAGLVFLEIGNRVGGADVIDVTKLKTGIHLPTAELQVLLRQQERALYGFTAIKATHDFGDVDNCAPWYGWFVFPGHLLNNRPCEIKVPDWLKTSPNVVRLKTLAPGKAAPDRITYQDWEVPVAGIVTGRDEHELTETVLRIFSEVEVVPL